MLSHNSLRLRRRRSPRVHDRCRRLPRQVQTDCVIPMADSCAALLLETINRVLPHRWTQRESCDHFATPVYL